MNDGVRDVDARLTDEDIERARKQIGIPTPPRNPQWNPIPDPTSISHFAFGCGDDNPLWHEPEYGTRTRWAGQIAPPLFPITSGVNVIPPFTDPEMRELFRGLFRGTGKYYSGVTWDFYRPIYPFEPLYQDGRTLMSVDVRHSSFAGTRSVRETYRTVFASGDGEPVAHSLESYVTAEREATRSTGKHAGIARQTYTPEDLAKINEGYATEVRRGAAPRYWEDVDIGEDIGHVVKGPLTVTDIVSFHMGYGIGAYGWGPLRYAWKMRQRMPNFYSEDEYGVPDVMQRLHWDQKRAEALGLPAPYDYGQMRTCWLSHLLTNWMGDEGWLWRLSTQARSFNFLGDTTWCTGTVGAKQVVDGHHVVDIELRSTNQRGEVTTPGTATLILPTREAPIALPAAALEIRQRGVELAHLAREAQVHRRADMVAAPRENLDAS
jgi:acyl dehydratase